MNRIDEMKAFLQQNAQTQQTGNAQPTSSFSNPYADEQAQLEAGLGLGSTSLMKPGLMPVGQAITKGIGQGIDQATQSGIGVGKGILNTVNNISQLGQKALNGLT